MNREQFDKLEISEQVQYINTELESNSLLKVCKGIGISESTVRSRFEGKGYTRVDKQFITTTKTTNETTDVKSEKLPKNKFVDNANIKALETKLNSLENELEGMKAILNTLVEANESKQTTTETTDSSIKQFRGNTVARSYKLNEEVQQKFKAFCKEHNEANVSDILANALVEYMNKFH